MRFIKKIKDFLLRKGIGVLRIDIFVIKEMAILNQISVNENFNYRIIDDHVLSDICVIRGEKKYNQLTLIQNKGGYGIALYKGNELAAYGWIGLNHDKNDKRIFTSFAIPPDSAHIFDCYTIEKFRGQKLYSAIVSSLVVWAYFQKVVNVYIDTLVENVAAGNAIIKLGFSPVVRQTKFLFFSKVLLEYDHKR